MNIENARIYETGKNKCEIFAETSVYKLQSNLLFSSVEIQGKEILAAPMRIYCKEKNSPVEEEFEQAEVFMVKDGPNEVVCAAAEGGNYIINSAIRAESDGWTDIELKLMPRGKNITQVFNLSEYKNPEFDIEELTLEIRLKKNCVTHYHYWPQDTGFSKTACWSDAMYGSFSLAFKPLLWLGTQNQGLCFYADSDENWTSKDKKTLEILEYKDEVKFLIHFLKEKPKSWIKRENISPNADFSPAYAYMPVTFRFGFQGTPVRVFTDNPYRMHGLHIDCFKKIKESYAQFLFSTPSNGIDDNYFDRMARLGVNTLFLHEKWHRIQNSGYYAHDTEQDIDKIVFECKKRGIRVIPYFGYEISTLSPNWTKEQRSLMRSLGMYSNGGGGWYRMPPQRDYIICYNSSYADTIVSDIVDVVKRFGFDGVYLDSTLIPWACANNTHGCGYTDEMGVQHPTFNVYAVRRFLKKLRAALPSNAIINAHISNCCNIPAFSLCDSIWTGEYVQARLNREGVKNLSFGLMQTEYTGRNMGVPHELIAYALPNWSFDNSLCLGLPHGILPRPNDADSALEIVAQYWQAIDCFPIEKSKWHPYWENDIELYEKNDCIKCSYYEYLTIEGSRERLLLIGNISADPACVHINIKAKYVRSLAGSKAKTEENGVQVQLSSYGAAIIYVVLS